MSDPYALFATQGVIDLIDADPSKMLPVIPQVIIPLKEALNTRNQHIIVRALRVIQKLVKDCPGVGEALVPYYRQLLPIFNLLKQKNNNLGDQILYSQRKGENLGDLIHETLQLMERNGGEDAYINIKYMIPTYESCL
mmetsp:Transcript_16297/g.41314  ORF Transcript_16297/g.41314 Transcript_16297/m.41314 type:complete len:138 (+) Transcript_16297:909-1322(+)